VRLEQAPSSGSATPARMRWLRSALLHFVILRAAITPKMVRNCSNSLAGDVLKVRWVLIGVH
jgi:hypothetical protein